MEQIMYIKNLRLHYNVVLTHSSQDLRFQTPTTMLCFIWKSTSFLAHLENAGFS